jgi:3-oxoacyl-[acyl-carrier protein] reductase
MMDTKLKNLSVIVTGGNGGIGSEITRAFAREGARVMIGYYGPREQADALVAELKGHALAMEVDVRDPQSVQRLMERTAEVFGRIDVLINNAGILSARQNIDVMDVDQWDKAMDVNLKGTFLCTRAAIPWLIQGRQSRIVNISSVHALAGGRKGLSAYASSKGAVISFTKSAAKELGEKGITVNAIAPGFIDAGMGDGIDPLTKQRIVEQCLLGRMGRADEIASLAVFLASAQAGYITGQIIACDGGRHDYCL